jgi:ATP-dependent helicase HrpB
MRRPSGSVGSTTRSSPSYRPASPDSLGGGSIRGLHPLPVDPFVPEILDAVARAGALVLTAAPGAGKTTRVAPALATIGPTLLLQPRRVAARAIARRIADERGWTLGEEVGWQVRFERRFTPRTRLLVATEGVLAARAQADPLLSTFSTIVLDEFHERSLHADLALALAWQARQARDDLKLVVMSATLDAEPIARFLGGCPVLHVPGRLHSLEIDYAPGQPVADAVSWALQRTTGHVLVFLPGAPEIRRALPAANAAARAAGAEAVPLHGSLAADEQDAAIADSGARRVILATNLAETSLTVPGVTAVVDSGLQKVVRFDPSRGIDSLDLERIPADSAEQRAGRAGRLGPGIVRRLWDARDRLRAHRQPEIERVDLCGLVLDVLAWGGDPGSIAWLEPPPPAQLEAAWTLLERLGAVSGRRLTRLGERIRRIPLHPRLACLLAAAGGAREAALACALLSDRVQAPAQRATTASDLLSALDGRASLPPSVLYGAREIERLARDIVESPRAHVDEVEFRRAVFAGYPDRVARRRAPGASRFLLASGHGAVLGAESGVRDAEFIVAVDVLCAAGQAGAGAGRGGAETTVEARIRVASGVEREWLTPTSLAVEHRFDAETESVRAVAVDRYDAIVLAERHAAPDPAVSAGLLADEWLARGPSADDLAFLRRCRFAGIPVDLPALVRAASSGARSLREIAIESQVPRETRATVDRLAPRDLRVPSGRTTRLTYRDDGMVEAAVKLQELFGLADSPCIGPRREPVVLVLLAPNGRPVQVTRDLRSFWDRGYADVRKELRGRYPKHPWPEDPWTATPTARTTRRTRGDR